MTIPEYVGGQTVRMAESFAHFIKTTDPEKLNWRPALEGAAPTRSILEQAGECVQVNRLIASLLRGEAMQNQASGRPTLAFADAEDAQAQLIASAQELAETMKGLSDGDLQKVYSHPRGEMRGENVLMMCLRNMAYHAGQANLIQMLGGDAEFHVPPTWR